MKVFITFQFGYCLLGWKFHNRGFNNKIIFLHERVWRITFGGIFTWRPAEKNNSATIHHGNIQAPANMTFSTQQNKTIWNSRAPPKKREILITQELLLLWQPNFIQTMVISIETFWRSFTSLWRHNHNL